MGGGNPGGSEIMPGGMPISDIFSIMDFGIICQHNSLISHNVFIKSVKIRTMQGLHSNDVATSYVAVRSGNII